MRSQHRFTYWLGDGRQQPFIKPNVYLFFYATLTHWGQMIDMKIHELYSLKILKRFLLPKLVTLKQDWYNFRHSRSILWLMMPLSACVDRLSVVSSYNADFLRQIGPCCAAYDVSMQRNDTNVNLYLCFFKRIEDTKGWSNFNIYQHVIHTGATEKVKSYKF